LRAKVIVKPAKPKWGGSRPNSGLPKIEGGKRTGIILTPDHIEKAKKIGGGSVSNGVRIALDKATV